MPAFESDINDKAASTLRLVMHWQYMTISRGGSSIYELLRKEGIRPEDYITFYGLRNWDLIRDKRQYPPPTKAEIETRWHTEASDQKHDEQRKEDNKNVFSFVPRVFKELFGGDDEVKTVQAVDGEGKLEAKLDLEEDSLFVSELVYIHTKLMIVDDRYVICGSANINDRSMMGNRDSEIAIFVEDTSTVDIRMAGQPYKAGKIAHDLRNRIFREHLGIMPDTDMEFICHLPSHVKPRMPTAQYTAYIEKMNKLIEDPLSKPFWDFWANTAKKNTAIYRRMFRCVPDDTVATWKDYDVFVVKAKDVLPGHVVNKDMTKQAMQKELFDIQGHLVEFPTEFLKDEELKAAKWAAENLMPEDVFT
jgi:phospholipase D1/2